MEQAPPSQSGPAPGTPLGPYDLLTPVGTGGMAQVWAARARETGHVVALKLLLPELAENESFRQMFYDEACIASLAAHPNVCRIHHLSQDQGTLYLAMEWVDGTSLMRLVRPDGDEDSPALPLPVRLAAHIVADACAGLDAAHGLRGENGQLLEVVHRDVSPHNVLVGRDGTVKVTDFGVAKALGKLNVTVAGQIKGKLAYMSPEQLMGGDLDRRTDVFALGTVLYEITTGRRPFVGEHDPQVMAAIAMGEYPPAISLVPGYPRELSQILDRALANDPRERFQSAADLGRALESFLARSGPPVTPADVAAMVRARVGHEVEEREQRIREAMRTIETSRARPAVLGPDREASPGIVWMLAAALLGVGLGLGVLAYVKTQRRPAPRPSNVTATKASPSVTTSPRPLPMPDALVAAPATPSTEAVDEIDAVVLPAPAAKPRARAPASAPTPAAASASAEPKPPPNPYQ